MDPRNSQGQDRVDYREEPGDLTEVHAAIQREHRDPSADTTPIPLWLTIVCGAALVWAGGYFMTFHGGLRSDVFNERQSSPSVLFGEVGAGAKGAAGEAAAAPVSLAQAGKSVYSSFCVACHQGSGQGLPGQFPSLSGTEFVKAEKRIVAIILKGVHGPLTVKGATFNGSMPPQATLNDKKIAQVASYVRSSFGNEFPEIDEAKVAVIRKEFADHASQWTEQELLAMPADISTGPSAPAAAGAAPAAPAGGAPAAAPAAGAPAAGGKDLMALGKTQYAMICQACHQPNGMGLPSVFPPLAKSEWVAGDPQLIVGVILKGLMGPITVDGKPFNNMMPGHAPMLNDEKIAAVATYVRNSFGNSASPVAPEQVAELRKKFESRATPWTEAELKAAVGAGGAPAPAPAQ